MKKIILILCFIIMVPFRINAEETDNNNLELGGYLMTPKISYNIDYFGKSYTIYEGIVDFGISCSYPLNKSKDVIALLEVGYANYAFREDGEKSFIVYPEYHTVYFNTINISPQICLKGFTAGFDLGFFFPPDLINVSPSSQYDYNPPLYGGNKLKSSILLNLKLGGIIPIYKTKKGTLNVLIKATTSLSYIGKDLRPYNIDAFI